MATMLTAAAATAATEWAVATWAPVGFHVQNVGFRKAAAASQVPGDAQRQEAAPAMLAAPGRATAHYRRAQQ